MMFLVSSNFFGSGEPDDIRRVRTHRPVEKMYEILLHKMAFVERISECNKFSTPEFAFT